MRPTVSKSIIISSLLLLTICMMVLPIPSWLLDIGFAASFAFSILIFVFVLLINRPLEFSIFPTLLLFCLTLRLALNIASTKLIIGEGHTGTASAGHVIDGFSQFIMSGSIFLGSIIFCTFLIVNFLVINKGASRMAEVSARFALDGMPGKQLAIDSDMSSGAISFEEARERRQEIQDETAFFGSLDGASKFIRGDAIAGLLITLLNLIGGFSFGVLAHDLSPLQAIETYAILTVGDGLVSQIPAIIISIAAAILLSRSGIRTPPETALIAQISKFPQALFFVGLLLLVFALLPGLPFTPFALGSVVFAGLGSLASATRPSQAEDTPQNDATHLHDHQEKIGDVLDVDIIHIEFSPDLVSLVLDDYSGLDARISNMRRYIATKFGLILPEIRLTDSETLERGEYVVKIQGVEVSRGSVRPGCALVLAPETVSSLPNGWDVLEPVYGARARWIEDTDAADLALSGVTTISPLEVLATHLLEVLKRNLSRLLTLSRMRIHLLEITNLNDESKSNENKKLLDEFIPDKVPLDCLHAVLRLLLEEQVSIRNLELIIEAIAEARNTTTKHEAICEHVRQRLGFQLIADLRTSDGTVPLIQLAPEWEDIFQAYQVDVERGLDVALPPEVFNRLANHVAGKLNELDADSIFPAVVTNTRRRRFLRTIMRAKGLNNPVLSFEELGVDARPALMGLVEA